MDERLPEFRRGQPLTAAQLNMLVEHVKRALKISVAAPLMMTKGVEGVTIGVSTTIPRFAWFELKTELNPGGDCEGRRMRYNGTDPDDGEWVAIEDIENETLYDVYGTISGEVGDTALCKWSNEAGRWEIVNISCTP
jgi:hypothetical protein